MPAARFTSFLVKLASRCNLDCDYCYVYHHADQSWRSLPPVLSPDDRRAFTARLADYVSAEGLTRCAVIFHGGEPLLAGGASIVEFASSLRASMPVSCSLDIGLQTNGLLLSDDTLEMFRAERIGVSLSLDGPRHVNDLHRNSRKGRSSFDRANAALTRLTECPEVFSGVIAVIDPRVSPEELFKFFIDRNVPKLDFLLPDANYSRPPPFRDAEHDIYAHWLISAFDLWFDKYSDLKIRTFEALLDACIGLPSGTDAFGFGEVTLLTIETDGSYHDLDVLKVAHQGATKLEGSVRDTPIRAVAESESIARHASRLTLEGLCSDCRSCRQVGICGGGAIPHRYGNGSYDNPSIYCSELFGLISHVKHRLQKAVLAKPSSRTVDATIAKVDMDHFERAESAADIISVLWEDSCVSNVRDLRKVLQESCCNESLAEELLQLEERVFRRLAVSPDVIAWRLARERTQRGKAALSIDGTSLAPALSYLSARIPMARSDRSGLDVGRSDSWLRCPFGDSVVFEDGATVEEARLLVEKALAIIEHWRPSLAQEIRAICSDVQIISDPTADPEKIVSFSDNSVPGALYVSVKQGADMIDAYDLADSIIHEHRHQKLYLLERLVPLMEVTAGRVKSPWREDLRPPSGLLHAIFVFVDLRRFWSYVLRNGPAHLASRAENQMVTVNRQLAEGFSILRTCPLTAAGERLADTLEREAGNEEHAFAA